MLRTQWTRRLRLVIAALLAVVLLAASMGASIRGAEAQEPPGLARALEAKENNVSALMAHPGVVGVGVGLNAEGEPVVRVLLARDGVAGLPSVVDRVPVETVVSGLIVARCDSTTDDCNPAPLGVSIGHPDVTAGTLGALVANGDGDVFILSNNHVLANVNNASIGDNILQPGSYDGGTVLDDTIATLADFVPLNFSGRTNSVDAAIARPISGGLVTNLALPSLVGDYGTPTTATLRATVEMPVQKCGRTTGCTTGVVSTVSLTVSVCYQTAGPFRCKKSALFTNQIGITDGTFSAGGDSGSLIVDTAGDPDPVGLLFAGSDTMTIANPIDEVLDSFNLTMFDGNLNADPTATATPDPTATATPDPTPEPTPTTDSLTLTDLGSLKQGRSWVGWVEIDLGADMIAVDWSWSNGGPSGNCAVSLCAVNTGDLSKKIGFATLTITGGNPVVDLAQITVLKP